MKRAFLLLLVSLNLVAGLEVAWPQAEEKPEPKPPYLAPVPDYGHWIVRFKYESQPSPGAAASSAPSPSIMSSASTTSAKPAAPTVPDGYLTSIETIKTGDLRGVTLAFSGGASQEYTCQGNWVLRSTPKGPQLGIATPTSPPYGYYTAGFILLDGVTINMSTFKETALHNAVMAFHYKSGDTDVWISPDSLLPLAVKRNGVEGIYEFLTPPPRPFPIPKDQESLLQKEQAAYKATSSMR